MREGAQGAFWERKVRMVACGHDHSAGGDKGGQAVRIWRSGF